MVREELAGRGDKIKAYTVAVDALGRPESFDASSDPVIRVVANRLRQALERFYADTDTRLDVHIDMVKGSYRPVFSTSRPQHQANAQVTPPARDFAAEAAIHRRIRRYHLIITIQSILLILAITYVVWDLNRGDDTPKPRPPEAAEVFMHN